MLELLLGPFVLLTELPVVGTGKDVQSTDLGPLLLSVRAVQELGDPFVPAVVELLQDLTTLTLLAEGVVYRVHCQQLEVFQCPVV
jgi:hypothetical protein